MMKLLLDQGLPRSAVGVLHTAGLGAVHTSELGLATASDSEILERAVSDGCVVITLDTDFHSELAVSGATKPSVIRVRIEGLRGADLAALLIEVIRDCQAALEAGAVVSVQEGRMRLRRLPIREKTDRAGTNE